MMLQKNIFLGYAISSIWNGLLGALLLFGIDFYLILLAVNSPEVAKIFTPRMLVAHGSRLYVYIIYLYISLSLSLSSLASLSFSFFPLPLLQEAEAGRRHGRRGRAGQSRAGQARAWKLTEIQGDKTRTKKQLHIFYLKNALAQPSKVGFRKQNLENSWKSGMSGVEDKHMYKYIYILYIYISSIWKHALAQPPKS